MFESESSEIRRENTPTLIGCSLTKANATTESLLNGQNIKNSAIQGKLILFFSFKSLFLFFLLSSSPSRSLFLHFSRSQNCRWVVKQYIKTVAEYSAKKAFQNCFCLIPDMSWSSFAHSSSFFYFLFLSPFVSLSSSSLYFSFLKIVIERCAKMEKQVKILIA